MGTKQSRKQERRVFHFWKRKNRESLLSIGIKGGGYE